MRKILLFVFLVLLNGCALNTLQLKGEIDQVTVVKYTSYMKHHRAFLSREDLKVIKGGKKYLYLYNEKNNDLALFLYRENQYLLYNFSDPKQKTLSIKTRNGKKYTHALRSFKRIGYKSIDSPMKKGFIVSVSHKRYKGVKTLMVDVKEYTRLQKLYKNAIRTYDASKIKNIQTTLPKILISDYFTRYKKKARTHAQLTQLQIIAKKLKIEGPSLPKKPTTASKVKTGEATTEATIEETEEEELAWYASAEEEANEISAQEPSGKPYKHYLKDAHLDELSTYLSKEASKNSLSHSQYRTLQQRENTLKEEKLFQEGSMEELIEAYKVNKNPKYKERIMSLMKEKQQHKTFKPLP